jgi:outer membrane autotransporter protein
VNTYTGTTTINAGTLKVSGGSAIANAGAVSLANVAGAIFELSNSETIGSLAGGGALGGNVTLNANTLTVGDATNTTYSGAISGTGALTKQGAGALTLSGTNTYTGATNINAGTLTVTANQALGTNAAGTTVADGATLGISGGINYAVTEALTLNGAGAASRSGALDNITGNNTFAGPITLASASTIGSTANTLTASGTINNGGFLLTVGGAGDETLSGVISGTGALTKAGAGTATLSGINTYSGITTINVGKVSIGADTGLGAAPGGTTAGKITFGGGTLESSGTFTLNANRGIALTGAGTIDVDAGQTLTYGGIIAGASTLTKADTGTLSLGGTNTYTGTTNINAGTLTVTANQALGTNAAGTTVADGATLGIYGGINYVVTEALTLNGAGAGGMSGALDNITGDNTFAGDITLASASTIGSTAGTLTASGAIDNGGFLLTVGGAGNEILSGIISGTGALTKNGAGALTLSGTNTYSGTTTISGGTLRASGGSAIADTGAVSLDDIAGAFFELLNSETIGSLAGGGTTGGNVNLNANTLTVGDATNTTYSGAISGAGVLTKQGVGALTLAGTNTHSGGTTLNAGTIILGADAALGTGGLTLGGAGTLQSNDDARSVSNAIATGGNALTVSGTSNLTLSGVISGTGSLTTNMTTAADTLTLSGTNTYTGGTTVTQGNLTGTTNSLQGNITNNAAVTFDQGTAGTYAGIMSGTGTLTKAGAGILTLSGTNTFNGLTTLNAGGLILNGQVGGALTVAGGTLSGIGTIGGTVTLNGGTFSPGNSIGTTTILGNYVQNAGSTLEVEVSKAASGALSSDFLDVAGSATLVAGSTIHVLDITPPGRLIGTGDTFNIIEADGGVGVTGNGPTITDNSAVLSFAGSVSGNFYQLAATRQTFASVALGGGGGPLAAIDSDIANASGDYITVINALTALNSAQLDDAAEKLNPLPYASTTSASLRTNQRMASNLANYLSARRSGVEGLTMLNAKSQEGQLLIADASSDPKILGHVIRENERIAKKQQEEGKISGFFRPFGMFYEHDSTPKLTGFDAKAVGAQFGFDKRFGSYLIMGIGGGYSHSFINFKESRGESDTDSFRVGPYATYFKDDFFLDTSVSLGFHNIENKRNIQFGTINRTAEADYYAYDLSAYIGGGYDFHVNKWTITPTTSFQYISYRNESFKETGAGAAGLDVDAATSQSLRSKLGVTLSTITELHGTKIVPELFAGWAHEFMNNEDLKARFVEGTAKFTTDVDGDRDDSVYFGAGISALLKKNISAFVRYEGEYSSGNNIKALNVGITILF